VRRDSVWEGSSPGRLEVEAEVEVEAEDKVGKMGDEVEDASPGLEGDWDEEEDEEDRRAASSGLSCTKSLSLSGG
jgi:hypothetical protein